MARFGSGIVVTGLTTSALVLVTVLALQAKGAVQATTTATGAAPGATAGASTGPSTRSSAAAQPVAVPAASGSGKRVVYALGAKRVWLVDPAHAASDRTFTVQPSPVGPVPGTYSVTSKTARPLKGSDGVYIKNTVVFTRHSGVIIGFSSAVDGTTPAPDASLKTGGIRETLGDGQALFNFAATGTKVVVVG